MHYLLLLLMLLGEPPFNNSLTVTYESFKCSYEVGIYERA